jgi:hypothetical protein
MPSIPPTLGMSDNVKCARIIETSPTKRSGTFWYRLIVVRGPLPPGTILWELNAPRAFVDEGAVETRPDPDARRRAISRLRAWAHAHAWIVADEASSAEGIETIAPPKRPTPTVPAITARLPAGDGPPKVARIVEHPATLSTDLQWYTVVAVSGLGLEGKPLLYVTKPRAREPTGVFVATPDRVARQAALAEITTWAQENGWQIEASELMET